MKRFLIAAALAVALCSTLLTPAHAFVWKGPCTGWKNGQHLRNTTPVAVAARRNRHLIRCVFATFGASTTTALQIADRESNFNPWAWHHAYSWSHDCLGSFQHMRAYWDDRVRRYLKAKWFPRSWPHVSPFDPRANAIVTARMTRAGGWGPWSSS